jgi:hypothetical protein
MSCFHRDRERSEGKMGESAEIGSGSGRDDIMSAVVLGNMASR